MEVIRLTNKELEDLPIISRDGYESIIYFYNDSNKGVALKVFKKQDFKITRNKLNKLITLNKLGLDNLTNIQKIVVVNDVICGYSMEYQKDFYSLLDLIGINKRQTKITYLKMLKEVLIKLHNHNIILGDFNPQNFLIKQGMIKFCDIDNWQVQNYPQDIFNVCQNNYLSYNLPIDNCLDAYLFNTLTVAVLKNIYYIYVPNYIRQYKVFSNKEADELANSIIHLTNGYKEEYIIDCFQTKEKRLSLQSNKHLWI